MGTCISNLDTIKSVNELRIDKINQKIKTIKQMLNSCKERIEKMDFKNNKQRDLALDEIQELQLILNILRKQRQMKMDKVDGIDQSIKKIIKNNTRTPDDHNNDSNNNNLRNSNNRT